MHFNSMFVLQELNYNRDRRRIINNVFQHQVPANTQHIHIGQQIQVLDHTQHFQIGYPGQQIQVPEKFPGIDNTQYIQHGYPGQQIGNLIVGQNIGTVQLVNEYVAPKPNYVIQGVKGGRVHRGAIVGNNGSFRIRGDDGYWLISFPNNEFKSFNILPIIRDTRIKFYPNKRFTQSLRQYIQRNINRLIIKQNDNTETVITTWIERLLYEYWGGFRK